MNRKGRKVRVGIKQKHLRDNHKWDFPSYVIIARCPDCRRIIWSEAGRSRRAQVVWQLCERCAEIRNGVRRRNPWELRVL